MAKRKSRQTKKPQRPSSGAKVARRKTAKTDKSKILFAIASPRSVGGVSMFEAQQLINEFTVQNFISSEDVVRRSVAMLRDAGFDVLQATPTMINISGPRELYDKAFQTKIFAEERPVIKEEATEDTAEFFDTPDTEIPGLISTTGTRFEELLEGVAIEEPRYFMAPTVVPPLKSYWHLQVPADISVGCNADRAHRLGITGKGVKIAMVDSGWFKHPFFESRGYRVTSVTLGPGASAPEHDESGHGTGESANIFAVAPDIELFPVKINFVNSVGAFNSAVGLAPNIITCSWGSHKPSGPLSAADQALAAAIASAVVSGISVVFSAGNGHAGFPGQHPDVLSAGGVFMDRDESLQASNYASGFNSAIYVGRRVPDLSGLVGMRPRAIYIMLPLEPGDSIDVGNSGGTHPNGDETTNNDGWAAFSGTSAAAPQLAGAAALVKQAHPTATPAEVKEILMKTARDVTAGQCNIVSPLHMGLSAAVGPDAATGNGLVDAYKAALLARVRSMGGGLLFAETKAAPFGSPISMELLADGSRSIAPLPQFATFGTPKELGVAPPRTDSLTRSSDRLSPEEMLSLEQVLFGGSLWTR